MQIDLQREQENAYKAIKRSEHLERKYEITTKRMQDLIDQYRTERDDAIGQNSKLMYEKTIHDDVIAEKDSVIHNKTTLIEVKISCSHKFKNYLSFLEKRLEENIRIKEEEMQNMRNLNHAIQEENRNLNQVNKELQLSIGSSNYQVVSLEKQLKRDQELFEEFKNNLRSEMKQKEVQYQLEFKMRNQLEKETAGLFHKIMNLEEKLI